MSVEQTLADTQTRYPRADLTPYFDAFFTGGGSALTPS